MVHQVPLVTFICFSGTGLLKHQPLVNTSLTQRKHTEASSQCKQALSSYPDLIIHLIPSLIILFCFKP